MSKKWRELKRTEPMQKGDCLYDKTGLKHIVGLAWSGITIKEYEKFWGTITSGYRERPKRPSLAKLVRRLPLGAYITLSGSGCAYLHYEYHDGRDMKFGSIADLKSYLLTLPERSDDEQ